VVYIDSIITSAIFGRCSRKASGKKFKIRVLSNVGVEEYLNHTTLIAMKEMFNYYHRRFNCPSTSSNAAWYMMATADLATKMWDEFPVLRKNFGMKETLEWFDSMINEISVSNLNYRILRAYSLLIIKHSSVRLTVVGTYDGCPEFGVKATRNLLQDEFIYELAGLIPTDGLAAHSNLSTVTPHPDQGEGTESRVLFGPIRYINHHCTSYNVQVCKLSSSVITYHVIFTVYSTPRQLWLYYPSSKACTEGRRVICKLWSRLVWRRTVPLQCLQKIG
jgi:hypothetical protein